MTTGTPIVNGSLQRGRAMDSSIIRCFDCGKPVLRGKFKVGDVVWRKGYGVGRCAKVKIIEASPNIPRTGFVYKVPSISDTSAFNYVCEDDLYQSLEDLKSEWLKIIENPIIEDKSNG